MRISANGITYNVKSVDGHFVITDENGQFVQSADSLKEIEDDLNISVSSSEEV